MSVTIYENSVKRKKDEIARLKKERVRYVNVVSDCSKKILNATKQASSTKSSSTYKSKINEIARENKKNQAVVYVTVNNQDGSSTQTKHLRNIMNF